MKPQSALPCLFLPPWCPAQLTPDLVVGCSDGEYADMLPLADALRRLGRAAAALILPVERVASCAVALPGGNVHWQRQALPYAVEPLLAEDVEALHLAMGTQRRDGRYPVRAINRSLLQAWLDHLRGQGLRITMIHVDADLLPLAQAALLWDSQRCLLAAADETRLALSPAQLPLASVAMAGDLHVYHAVEATPCLPMAAEFSLQTISLSPLAWMATQRAQALDMAQGAFAVKSRMQLWQWKPLAAALALVACAQLVFDGAQAWLLNQQADGYRQANEAIYKGLFPQEQRIVNLKAQFDQHLQQGASASRFSDLLGSVAAAMPADGALQLQQLEFDAASVRMELQLQGGDSVAKQALQQRLQAGGMQVQTRTSAAGALQLSVGAGQ